MRTFSATVRTLSWTGLALGRMPAATRRNGFVPVSRREAGARHLLPAAVQNLLWERSIPYPGNAAFPIGV